MIDKLLLTPFQKFFKIESSSGMLLFIATILAIIWANSPFGDSYQNLWQYKIGFSSQSFEFSKPLILWVNDGLMAVFFFLIGLEIKREMMIGELNTPKKAAFPIVAAIGGMTAPVLLFFILNKNPETSLGWGIPMATDIAFSLAILSVLGKRIPISLKIFLTAFAIIDDLGAVLVIALFYSNSINWMLLVYALGLLAVLFILSYFKIYAKYMVFIFGIAVWLLFLKSGIHPTIAGVLLAMSIPIYRRADIHVFSKKICALTDKIRDLDDTSTPILSKEQISHIDDLESWVDKVQSPLQHLEHKLHSWVAYVIMPVFAFANAGVIFSFGENTDISLITNIILALVIGNAIGISTFSWIGKKTGLIEFPDNTKFISVIGISFLAGIGFTMSIFIANLAFGENILLLESAKIGILTGSLISGTIGYIILKLTNKN